MHVSTSFSLRVQSRCHHCLSACRDILLLFSCVVVTSFSLIQQLLVLLSSSTIYLCVIASLSSLLTRVLLSSLFSEMGWTEAIHKEHAREGQKPASKYTHTYIYTCLPHSLALSEQSILVLKHCHVAALHVRMYYHKNTSMNLTYESQNVTCKSCYFVFWSVTTPVPYAVISQMAAYCILNIHPYSVYD